MMATAKNEDELRILEALLRRKFMTASQIAQATGCSKPTAYARVLELQKRGVSVTVRRMRVGSSGPEANAFGIGSRARTGAMRREDKRRLVRFLDETPAMTKADKKRLIAFFS